MLLNVKQHIVVLVVNQNLNMLLIIRLVQNALLLMIMNLAFHQIGNVLEEVLVALMVFANVLKDSEMNIALQKWQLFKYTYHQNTFSLFFINIYLKKIFKIDEEKICTFRKNINI
mmetsp:Transcript_34107/g.44013  ORF Transcript_34107/g.44013 Transcript_34107/m.44013 type:complete len:115 (+) Transcript_34107:378-722(+)